MDKEFRNFRRGDVYFANLNPCFGSEQGGTRPVLIVQRGRNAYSPTVVAVPATRCTNKKPYIISHVLLDKIPGAEGKSLFLLEQIRTIDKRQIHRYIGHLTKEQMRVIDDALCDMLGLTEEGSF